jgi:hypothetical protein
MLARKTESKAEMVKSMHQLLFFLSSTEEYKGLCNTQKVQEFLHKVPAFLRRTYSPSESTIFKRSILQQVQAFLKVLAKTSRALLPAKANKRFILSLMKEIQAELPPIGMSNLLLTYKRVVDLYLIFKLGCLHEREILL